MNRATTHAIDWRTSCLKYVEQVSAFELNDVTTKEHKLFVRIVGDLYGLQTDQAGTKVIFTPTSSAPVVEARDLHSA